LVLFGNIKTNKMTQNDFLIWLRGFLEAIPKGHSPNWDILKEKIETVKNHSIIINCNSTNMGRTTTHIVTYNQNVPHTLTN